MYPILDNIEINSNTTKISDAPVDSEISQNHEINNINTRNQEEAFQEANNYVCSEMLDCSWSSNTNEDTVTNDRVSLTLNYIAATKYEHNCLLHPFLRNNYTFLCNIINL